jgi:hypothetical protein
MRAGLAHRNCDASRPSAGASPLDYRRPVRARESALFIVWGKTIKRQKLGYVADYCGVCRDLRAFHIKRVGSASHVYYISFGDGELVGYERTCQACNTAFDAAPETYTGMSKVARPGNELISETFPNYYTVYREVIERERKVRDTPSLLTPAERRARLREPFRVLAPIVQQKLASTQVDGRVWMAIAAFIPLLWAIGSLVRLVAGADDENAATRWALVGMTLGVGLIVSQLVTSGRRYVLKNAVPQLAQALASLRPSQVEITDILAELKQHKLKLGSKLRATDVTTRIEQERQAG